MPLSGPDYSLNEAGDRAFSGAIRVWDGQENRAVRSPWREASNPGPFLAPLVLNLSVNTSVKRIAD